MFIARQVFSLGGQAVSKPENLSVEEAVARIQADLAQTVSNGLTDDRGYPRLWLTRQADPTNQGELRVVRYGGTEKAAKALLRFCRDLRTAQMSPQLIWTLTSEFPGRHTLLTSSDPIRGALLSAADADQYGEPSYAAALEELLTMPETDFLALIALEIEHPYSIGRFVSSVVRRA